MRPARPEDGADALLYVSAAPYYDRLRRRRRARARALLRRALPAPGHTASCEVCRVAEADGAVVGVLAALPGRRRRRARAPLHPAHAAAPAAVAAGPAAAPPARRRGRRPAAARADALRRRARRRPRAAPPRRGARAARRRRADGRGRTGSTASRSTPGCENRGARALYERYGFAASAAAAARPTSGPRARSAARASSATSSAEQAAERLGDARDLALGHLREERQRDRARRDVLADRELALAGGRSARGRSDIRWIAGR